MAAISIGVQRGLVSWKLSDYTIGTNAPAGSSDIEVRYNNTDQLGKNLNREDLKIALDQIWRVISEGQGIQSPAGTPFVGGPFGPPS